LKEIVKIHSLGQRIDPNYLEDVAGAQDEGGQKGFGGGALGVEI
jgi:hypothetical protein